MKNEVQRQCIICREKKNKKDMIRIVKNKEHKIYIDLIGNADGRGAYICKNNICIEKLKKTKKLDQSFKMAVPKEVYDNLNNTL